MPPKDKQVHLNLNIKADLPDGNRAGIAPNNLAARSQRGIATNNQVSTGPAPAPCRIVVRPPVNSQRRGKQLSAVSERTPDLSEKIAFVPSDNSSERFAFFFFFFFYMYYCMLV